MMPQGSVPGQSVRGRASEVNGALAELDTAIDQLHQIIVELNDRLGSVLTSPESGKPGGGGPIPYQSSMATTIATYTARVVGARERIGELLGRLAI